jgi:oligopeptide/dipeptide ABC transporter ATP-binding protein
MNLLVDLQEEHGLAYLLVAHNLATVRYMCHGMAVMYLGVIQEMGETEKLFDNPMHIYTNALVSAALPSHPDIQRREFLLPGEVVSPIDPPPGDVFMSRTPLEVDKNHKYANERPPLAELEPDHWVVETPWSIATEESGFKVDLS